MSVRIIFLVAILARSTNSNSSTTDPKALAADKEWLQGTWEPTEIVWAGEKYSRDEVAGNKALFKGDKIEFSHPPPPGGFVPKKRKRQVGFAGICSFVLDQSGNPKAIDITRVDDGKATKGIYRIDGDILIMCIDDEVRPKSFESSKGTNTLLITLKRIKK